MHIYYAIIFTQFVIESVIAIGGAMILATVGIAEKQDDERND